MPILGKLTWFEHITYSLIWLFTTNPSFHFSQIRHRISQKRNWLCDAVNTLKHRKVLDYSPRVTFPKFMDLPPEIRAQIWRDALPGPRTIELRRDWDSDSIDSITQIPPPLQACHESRTVALKIYRLSFGSPTTMSTIYTSFAHDTIFFGRRWDFYGIKNWRILRHEQARANCRGSHADASDVMETAMEGFGEIESIALKLDDWSHWQLLATDLGLMPRLKEVVLVWQEGGTVWDLGPEPELVRFGGEGVASGSPGCTMQRFARELQAILRGDWMEMGKGVGSMPTVVAGKFAKGARDKWFVGGSVAERRTWPF